MTGIIWLPIRKSLEMMIQKCNFNLSKSEAQAIVPGTSVLRKKRILTSSHRLSSCDNHRPEFTVKLESGVTIECWQPVC